MESPFLLARGHLHFAAYRTAGPAPTHQPAARRSRGSQTRHHDPHPSRTATNKHKGHSQHRGPRLCSRLATRTAIAWVRRASPSRRPRRCAPPVPRAGRAAAGAHPQHHRDRLPAQSTSRARQRAAPGARLAPPPFATRRPRDQLYPAAHSHPPAVLRLLRPAVPSHPARRLRKDRPPRAVHAPAPRRHHVPAHAGAPVRDPAPARARGHRRRSRPPRRERERTLSARPFRLGQQPCAGAWAGYDLPRRRPRLAASSPRRCPAAPAVRRPASEEKAVR
jgi:hypothetical protein